MCDSNSPHAKPANDHLGLDFLSKFGHEVRSPLNAIIGFSEMLHDEVFGALTDPQRDVAEDILGAGRHLKQLVNDVIDIHKIHSGVMPLSIETLSLAQVVQQAVAATAPAATDRDTYVSHAVPPELAVTADERRLAQVLCGLLDNAIRHSPEGTTVQIAAERQDGFIHVSVSDTGHGIPHGEQDRVFEPFTAIDREGQSGGTGLGLPLSRSLVALMGGTMAVVSTPGVGSTFSFTLPAAVAPPQ